MSLIQQALEKAGRAPVEIAPAIPEKIKMTNFPEPPAPAPSAPKVFPASKPAPVKSSMQNKIIFRSIILMSALLSGLCIMAWLSVQHPAKIMPPEEAKVLLEKKKAITKTPADPVYKLTGITLISENDSIALINNQVARKGDALPGNAVVKEIAANYVLLDYQGREIKISL